MNNYCTVLAQCFNLVLIVLHSWRRQVGCLQISTHWQTPAKTRKWLTCVECWGMNEWDCPMANKIIMWGWIRRHNSVRWLCMGKWRFCTLVVVKVWCCCKAEKLNILMFESYRFSRFTQRETGEANRQKFTHKFPSFVTEISVHHR